MKKFKNVYVIGIDHGYGNMKTANPLGGLLQFVQTPSAQTSAEKENNAETEEAVLDFLDSF